MRRGFELVAGVVVVCAGIAATPGRADAFCGFYVSGADATLFNNATQVVLMREGTRTVLSMQNNYQGPPQDFAMVVPVPVVLQEENVKTLPMEIFSRVDQLSAPRLVEYWEQDPCQQMRYETEEKAMAGAPRPAPSAIREKAKDLGVTVEAQFEVGEYQIVILSAKDSTGLETWLTQEHYKIPAGAEPFLKPYVEQGSKFFVAKVDVEKVTFKDGQAMLSPLRFHYDSNKFDLPIRLGLMNSAGTQDLIVHILAPGKRYQTANYDNVTIPTNIDVRNEARERFGEFYAALFDRTLTKHPKAVVTEYAWDASSCDPCPTPALAMNELATLGLDVLYTPMSSKPKPKPSSGSITSEKKGDAVDDLVAPRRERPPVSSQPMRMPNQGFVLTRLHARYDKTNLGEDLVFEEAEPIMGGREVRNGPNGTLEEGAQKAGMNNFQARYAIRHEWEGAIACANPMRGVWGGPPAGQEYKIQAAQDLAFVARGKTQLAMMVKQDVPEIDVKAGEAPPPEPTAEQPDKPAEPTAESDKPPATPTGADDGKEKKGGCGCSTSSAGGAWALLLCAAAIAAAVRRRRAASFRKGANR